jgi:hypothetical protein
VAVRAVCGRVPPCLKASHVQGLRMRVGSTVPPDLDRDQRQVWARSHPKRRCCQLARPSWIPALKG